MRKCQHCGYTTNWPHEKFCSKCGKDKFEHVHEISCTKCNNGLGHFLSHIDPYCSRCGASTKTAIEERMASQERMEEAEKAAAKAKRAEQPGWLDRFFSFLSFD